MTLKILHVGVGVRGGHWVEFVRDHPDTVPAGFVDPDPEALRKAETSAGGSATAWSDLESALDDVDVDAAIIASPSPLHASQTRACLEAGLGVLVEKPFARSVAEAREVLRVAERTGRPVVVAENYRFWPSERTIRGLLADGFLGRLDTATLVDRRPMPPYEEGRWERELQHPQLQEIAIHHFDSMRAWFGTEATAITARTWNPSYSAFPRGACSDALVEMGDVRVQYLGTMTSHRFSFSLSIEGEKGRIWSERKRVFWRPAGSRFFRPVRVVDTPPGDEASYPKGGTTSLLNALRDAIRDGTTAETSGADNVGTVAMVEAAEISVREGRTVALREVLEG